MQPPTLRSAAVVAALAAYQPEVIVVVAYGNILPVTVLNLPQHGCVNVHASLLPKYRGAAPINWALLNGEEVTGCTIIHMDEHVDTGPILWRAPCPITDQDDAVSLGLRLAELGAAGLIEVLVPLEHGTLSSHPQPEVAVSYAPKLTREMGHLDWQQPATTLRNMIRGLLPWPGARARFGAVDIKFWQATVCDLATSQPPGTITAITSEGMRIACGMQQLFVHAVQPANRRRMTANEFVRGYHVQQGQRFD
jgi:methionyl-tRNA formyltransferase